MPSYPLLLILTSFVIISGVCAQDDFSVPIKCYMCLGKINNSTCDDPVDKKTNNNFVSEECIYGVCVKWTRYIEGQLYIERTCSAKLTIHIMLIDGVCRTESFGNGYLCMCGRNLCNGAHSNQKITFGHTIMLIFSVLTSQLIWLSWNR